MAERPGEQLTDSTGLDPVARTAGADSSMERYGDADTFEERNDGVETSSEETEHIKAQIEETRSQMGETIDAIQDRLSFANMSEQVSEQVSSAIESAKDSIYEATVGKVVYFMKNLTDDISDTKFVRTVQSNPFPIVLIGLGAGLLAYQGFSKSKKRPIRGLGRFESEGSGYRSADRDRAESESGRSIGGGVSEAAGSAYSSVSGAAGTAYSSVSDAAGSAYQTVAGKVTDVYSGAGDALNRAYESAGEYGSIAQDKYEYYIEENPLAVGAVAAALGAAVGLAFPSTRYEGQLMGEAKQNLVEKAQSAAGDLVEKAKHVAGEAGQTIKEEAKALAQ